MADGRWALTLLWGVGYDHNDLVLAGGGTGFTDDDLIFLARCLLADG